MANTRLSPGKALKSRIPLYTADFSPLASISTGLRVFIGCCVLVIVTLAWGYLLYLDHQMMQDMEQAAMPAGMDMPMTRAWTGAEIFFAFVMWIVMMAGMMAPSAMPIVLLFAGAHARRGKSSLRLMTLMFVAGYALVWAGFSALAALAQWALHDAGLLSPSMAAPDARISGAVLCAAGAWQFTPLKRACLLHCRSPLGFFMTHWREGKLGALQMGVRHGAYCLGCCWAAMLVLFVVGVMNLVWVAALALFVLLEKVGPAGMLASRVAGAAMIAAGIFFLLSA
jgi:predicted metal-binding membrane protein